MDVLLGVNTIVNLLWCELVFVETAGCEVVYSITLAVRVIAGVTTVVLVSAIGLLTASTAHLLLRDS